MGRAPDGVLADEPSRSEGGGSNPLFGERQEPAAPLPAGGVTFVITDIEGSTRLA